MQTNSGQPCGICGDIGYAKDIATCSKCRKAREHIYCMHPNLFNVPRSWHCEACRSSNIVHSPNCHSGDPRRYFEGNVQMISKRQKTWGTGNVLSTVPAASAQGMPAPQPLSRNFVPKKVEAAKVRFIDVVCARTGIKSKLSSSHGSSRAQKASLTTNHLPIPKLSSVVASPKSSLGKDDTCKSVRHTKPPPIDKVHPGILQKQAVELSQQLQASKSLSCFPCEPPPSDFPCKSPPSENIERNAVLSRRDTRFIPKGQHSSLNHTGPVVSGVQETHDFENTLSKLDKHAGKVDTLLSNDQLYKEDSVAAAVHCQEVGTSYSKFPFRFGEEDLPNPPAVDALWRGSFEVFGFSRETYDGFQAYAPGKVSSKVHLVSKQMPRVLKLTLQPRRFVWPDIFRTRSPCGFDVALYFWADDLCRENYNCLLEMMDNEDLSMRSRLDGVELLIFTSKQLPVESQSMNMRYYLWGIFLASKGRNRPVYVKEEEHDFDFPVHSHKVGESPAGTACKPIDLRVDMEIDSVDVKEERGVDGCLRINSRDTSNNSSQAVFSGVHSCLPLVGSIDTRHLHQMKREQYNDFDAPPGFSEPIRCHKVGQGSAGMVYEPNNQRVKKEVDSVGITEERGVDGCLRINSRDTSNSSSQAVFSGVHSRLPLVGSVDTRHLHQMKREQYDDFDAPPGFSKPISCHEVGQGSAGTAYEPNNQRVKKEVDSLGSKEDRRVDNFLRINSRGTPSNNSQGANSQFDDFDAPGVSRPMCSHKVVQGSAGTTYVPNNQRVNKEVDNVGHKEDRRVDSSLRINSGDTPSNNFQGENSQYEDFDAPPGFSRPMRSHKVGQGSAGMTCEPNNQSNKEFYSVEGKEDRRVSSSLRINSRDTSSNYSQRRLPEICSRLPVEETIKTGQLPQKKRVQDDYDAYHRFSRPITSNASVGRPIGTSLRKMPLDSHEEDTPDFPKLSKLRDKVFSFEVTDPYSGSDFIATPSTGKKGCDQPQSPTYSRRGVPFQDSGNCKAKFKHRTRFQPWGRLRRAKKTRD